MPCYVFDLDGKKHDLNPLIKLNGGYLVDDGNDSVDFYINICRSLSEWQVEGGGMSEGPYEWMMEITPPTTLTNEGQFFLSYT